VNSALSWRRLRLYIASAGLVSAFAFLLTTHSQHEAGSHSLPSAYQIEFAQPLPIHLGSPTQVRLSVRERASGTPIPDALAAESSLLLVLTSQDLSYYQDLAADYQGGGVFGASAVLPRADAYNVYASFTLPNSTPATSRVSITTADNPATTPPRLTVTPYSKIVNRMFENRYLVVVQWRGDSTPSNSMGMEFYYRVRDLSGQGGSSEEELVITPQGPLLIVSEDGRSYFLASPSSLGGVSRDAGGAQIPYALNTFPPGGRYKLFARLQHEDRTFLTDFTVELP